MFGAKTKQTILIDKIKLVYLPMIILLAVIVSMSLLGLYYNRIILFNQLKIDSLNLANQTVVYIDKYMGNKDIILNNMEEKLAIAGRLVLDNKDQINNDYLRKIANKFNIAEIYYYTPKGELIYSSSGEYIGWQASSGDPIHNYMTSNWIEYHEGIRKGTESGKYYKFSYFRDQEGNFVQLGIMAEDVIAMTDKYDYQNIVSSIAQNEDIMYAMIIDKNLNTIADSNLSGVGTDFSKNYDYREALNGKSSVIESYYDKIDGKVLEVKVPLVIDGNIEGVLAIGQSLKSLEDINRVTFIRLLIFSGLICILVLWLQGRYMINHIYNLNRDIHKLDIENNKDYYLPISNDNPFKGVYIVINQILSRIQEHIASINNLKNEMEHRAYYDALTSLPNRRFLIEKLEKALNDNKIGALFLIDLNDMKEINDTLGHSYGDEVLKTISKTLAKEMQENVFVSRFGGDEFVLMILGDAEFIHQTCINIMDSIRVPIEVNDFIFEIECSLGIALFPKDGTVASELLGKADIAMYHVKTSSSQGYAYFEPIMLDCIKENNQIYKILKQAVKSQEFKLLYQPIVEVKTGKISGFEALLKLPYYDIPTNKFIRIAEEKGLIKDIGRWVVQQVVFQLSEWKRKGIDIKPICVNLSPRQIRDKHFIEYLDMLLTQYSIEAEYIEIEITENVFIEDDNETILFLQKLRSMGIGISLDDFGSGYSSLSYLTFMPIDKIKLDKSINDKYLMNEKYNIIKHIIDLSHDLNLKIVAEGIESKEQFKILQDIECDFIQGYLLSKPVEATNVELLCSKNNLIEQTI